MLQCSCKRHRYKKPVALLAVVAILTLIFCLTACDSTGGKADAMSIPSYRSADASEMFKFAIPVKKTNFQSFASNHLYNFDGSLDDIYQKIKVSHGYDFEIVNDCILIEDTSNKKMGNCIIRPWPNDKRYNYAMTNMRFELVKKDTDNRAVIMLPLYMVDYKNIEEVNQNRIYENTLYPTSYGIDDFTSFYEKNFFKVTKDGNTLQILDEAEQNILQGFNAASEFKITFSDSGIIITSNV